MQVIRLVDGGRPDKLIAFDSLPNGMLKNVEERVPKGLGRHWLKFSPTMYVLDYKLTNKDMEKWEEITSFVHRVTDKNVRLLEKLENMAKPMAPDSVRPADIEPEDVPVIPIPKEFQKEAKQEEDIVEVKPELFTCMACEKEFKTDRLLKMHVGRFHKDQVAKEKVA